MTRAAMVLVLLCASGCAATKAGVTHGVSEEAVEEAAAKGAGMAAERKEPITTSPVVWPNGQRSQQTASESVGGEANPSVASGARTVGASPALAAPADSLTLRWTAPAFGRASCGPDLARPLRDPLRCEVLRLRGQAPAWRLGCEASVACWDSVRAQTVPDTVARLWAAPGAPCSVRVAAGEYTVVSRNAAGASCWSRVVG